MNQTSNRECRGRHWLHKLWDVRVLVLTKAMLLQKYKNHINNFWNCKIAKANEIKCNKEQLQQLLRLVYRCGQTGTCSKNQRTQKSRRIDHNNFRPNEKQKPKSGTYESAIRSHKAQQQWNEQHRQQHTVFLSTLCFQQMMSKVEFMPGRTLNIITTTGQPNERPSTSARIGTELEKLAIYFQRKQ